jgi:hypothetical protein
MSGLGLQNLKPETRRTPRIRLFVRRQRVPLILMAATVTIAIIGVLPLVSMGAYAPALGFGLIGHFYCSATSVSQEWYWTPAISINSPYLGTASGPFEQNDSHAPAFGILRFPFSERGVLASSTSLTNLTILTANGSSTGDFELDHWALYALNTQYSGWPGINDPCVVPYTAGILAQSNWWRQIPLQGTGNRSDLSVPYYVNATGAPWLQQGTMGSIGLNLRYSHATQPVEASCEGGSALSIFSRSSDPLSTSAEMIWMFQDRSIVLRGSFQAGSTGPMTIDYGFPGGYAGFWQMESLAPTPLVGVFAFAWSPCG